MATIPEATTVSKKLHIAVASVPIAGFTAWAIWHLSGVMNAIHTGNGLTLVWFAAFLFLWWIPVAWKERPYTATAAQQAKLDGLVVTVQIPVYNEDPYTLQLCLRSVFEQTRLPNRIRVVNDGSTVDGVKNGTPERYSEVQDYFNAMLAELGIYGTWDYQINQGKRHAQMSVLSDDPGDIFVTLDCDSLLDRKALAEGLKPFAKEKVQSVAGLVTVLNSRKNALTFMTSMLYLPFTRGLRSAQSVLKRVMVNSGTLAFYRAEIVREKAGIYENETFRGKPMQMNDDSMLTFYGMMKGDTVHQPSSVAFTLVPEKMDHYLKQQMRWMRGTFVRMFWWFKYLPVTSIAFWMPIMELCQLFLSVVAPVALLCGSHTPHTTALLMSMMYVGLGVNYMIALRFFAMKRSDEPFWFKALLFLTSPLTSIWRVAILRPMYFYALFTCWKIGKWGTRENGAEVSLDSA